jgi:signal transduction histidine kinase
MTTLSDRFIDAIWPQFQRAGDEHLRAYFTFQNYRLAWGLIIFILMTTALLPLAVLTVIYYQLIETSIDAEALLRTERLASNARRAVTFFLEERLDALTFTGNELGYDQLADPENLSEVLRNLKLGFGGLTDLSVIADTGTQVAYAGPFNLEGKDYSKQPWYIECQDQKACVSDIFSGYRDAPHMVVAIRFARPDGRSFILRATLETERLIQTLSSFKTGEHTDIFLINRNGQLQTPTQFYEGAPHRINIPIPSYSDRTQAELSIDENGQPIVVGYAFINTQNASTPFILMVVKQKKGLMKVWLDLRSNINLFFIISSAIIFLVITVTSTMLVQKIFHADCEKARTMVMAEQNCQLASIGQLAAGVAHEINNPLALINETAGYVRDLFQIEKRYDKDPELLDLIDSIIEAVDRCGTITGQLLGFARRFDVKIQPLSLKELISDVLNFHKKEAEYRNIAIHVDIPDSIPPITTDRGKLQQIVLNLVNNAFQAVSNECRLEIRAEMDGPEQVRLLIKDNGCGIPEELQPHLFEPFVTTKAEGKGTGLGLSITYGLVQKLHGKISVQSKAGEGTTFVVTLPVHLEKENQS